MSIYNSSWVQNAIFKHSFHCFIRCAHFRTSNFILEDAGNIITAILCTIKLMASIAYDSDGCHHIEKIDNIVTVFACGHRKCKKLEFGPCETFSFAFLSPIFWRTLIRHDVLRATFTETGFEHECSERAHVLRSINVYLILC